MKRIPVLLAITAALAVCIAQAQSTVYRWVDKDGKVQYTDSPPPADAKGIKERRLGGGGATSEESNTPYATQQATKRNPVTLYTGNDCGLCDQGRELLVRRGVPFSEKNAQSSEENMEALKKVAGDLIVPVMLVGNSKVSGYDEAQWNSALDAAGYARTRLPGQPGPRPDATQK